MRTIPDDVRERLLAVMRESRAEKLDSEETGRRLLAVDPDHPPGLLALGSARLAANDLEDAEGLLWRALAGAPTQPGYYFPLAALYRERGDANLSSRFVLLAMWKLSLYEQVPEGMAAAIQKAFPPLQDAKLSPEVFEDAAEQIEAGLPGPWPERLLPYWLLNEVQRGALGGLDPDMVRQIVGEAAACGPVFEAAVHEVYATKQSTLSVDSEALLTALLGEIGGVELIDDLIGADPDPLELFLHAHWAVRRLGQRFPEEAFARLRVAAAGIDYDVRAAIAEQLYFLPESTGARRAIGELLDGFEGGDEEAAYLLLTVSTLENSVETLKRHERQLSKEGRRWLREALEGDGEWAPELM